MESYVSAMDTVFLCGAGVMAVCVLLGVLLPKSRPVMGSSDPTKEPVPV